MPQTKRACHVAWVAVARKKGGITQEGINGSLFCFPPLSRRAKLTCLMAASHLNLTADGQTHQSVKFKWLTDISPISSWTSLCPFLQAVSNPPPIFVLYFYFNWLNYPYHSMPHRAKKYAQALSSHLGKVSLSNLLNCKAGFFISERCQTMQRPQLTVTYFTAIIKGNLIINRWLLPVIEYNFLCQWDFVTHY